MEESRRVSPSSFTIFLQDDSESSSWDGDVELSRRTQGVELIHRRFAKIRHRAPLSNTQGPIEYLLVNDVGNVCLTEHRYGSRSYLVSGFGRVKLSYL